MSIKIKIIKSADSQLWDAYVYAHPQANLYHLSGWKSVIEETYGHKTYYLMAIKDTQKSINPTNFYPACPVAPEDGTGVKFFEKDSLPSEILPRPFNRGVADLTGAANSVVGILPLVHLKHFILGDNLISIPFFDFCGILADNKETEIALLNEAVKLAEELGVKNIEFRNTALIHWSNNFDSINTINPMGFYTKTNKVRMLFELPGTSKALMKSFKSKLRSQIKKSLKGGLKAKIGSLELLDDFYKVFSINMRDLGSPVHSKALMKNVVLEFKNNAKIIVVYSKDKPLAGSLVVGFKDTLENPWASALREYSRLAPNMLLYWTMLEYACDSGFKYFDFGRSSPDEGTFKFKKQWGAEAVTLFWHYISLDEKPINTDISEKSSFELAAQVWRKLPVSVTKIIGPPIRKHIGL
jgi:FemAB-related protein (PEP-CTERM system-associated)